MRLELRPQLNLETVLQRRQSLAIEKRRIEEELGTIDDALGDYLDEAAPEGFTAAGFRVQRVNSVRRTLDKHQLVEQGVLPSTIEAATKETKFSFVKVSKAGDSNGTDASR